MAQRNNRASVFKNGLSVRLSRLLLTLGLTLATASFVGAQTTTATLTGSVTDISKAVIPQATIVVTDQATGVSREGRTDSAGDYVFASLPPSAYLVSVSAPGFSKADATVTLQLQQTQRLNIELRIGTGTEIISVSAATQQVQTETHEIASNVDAVTIEDLPSSGRDVFQTLTSTAAFSRDPTNSASSDNNFFGTANQSVQIGGLTYGFTSYLQDGVTNFNLLTKSANLQPTVEAVAGVSIVQNGASARFDEPSAVNVTTKSGTNQFHGRVYDYFLNDYLNAVGQLNVPKPPLRSNQFGVNIGGPVFRERLFFFLDYAGLRNFQSRTLSGLVPTAAERIGDFSADAATIYDPSTYNAATGTIAPFSRNMIPQARITTFGASAVNLFPSPTPSNIPGTNFVQTAKARMTYDSYLARLDGKISAQDTAYAAFENTDPVNTVPNGPGVSQVFTRYLQKATNAYVQETHVFSPQLLNVFRFGYNRSNIQYTTQAAGTQNFPAQFGITNLRPAPSQYGLPQVDLTTHSGFGAAFAPQGAIQNLYQLVDEVNYTIGRHYLFLGAEANRILFNGNWTIWNNGEFGFDGQYTSNHAAMKQAGGSDIADLLLGDPYYAFGSNGITVASFREYDVMPYIQDNWHLTRNLTLNLGLRYDFYQAPADKNHHSNVYDVTTNTNIPGTFKQNYLDFAPRFGFAYALPVSASVHGGYGIYYAPFYYNNLQFLLANPPNYSLQIVFPTLAKPVPVSNIFVANPTSSGLSPFTTQLKLPTQQVQEYNLSLEKAFGPYLASLSYVGNKLTHMQIRDNPNQANEALTPGQPQVRPYSYVGDVDQIATIGYSNYNSLVAQITRQFARGVTLNANYVWGKTLDVASSDNDNPEHGTQISRDYGRSTFDITNTFKLSGVYELPIGPGKSFLNSNALLSRELVGGWQISGLFFARGGEPFSVTANDLSNTGGQHEQRADQICPNSGFTRTRQQWFNTSCFTQPAVGRLGNESRDNLIGPRATNLDLSASKRFALLRETSLQLRGDFLNALNHSSYLLPNASVSSSVNGQITSFTPGRVIQLSLKVEF